MRPDSIFGTVTQAWLHEHFVYDDGWLRLVKRISPQSKNYVGDVPGYEKNGRWIVTLHGRKYFLHQLVWIYFYEVLPEFGIDHEDRNPMNNRVGNLRECTASTNAQNRIVSGVVFDHRDCKFQAKIVVDGRSMYGNRYADIAEAKAERRALEIQHHPYTPS